MDTSEGAGMYLIGIGSDDHGASSVAYIIKKRMKNVRHHYHLIEAACIARPPETDEALAAIVDLYRDDSYTVRKKLFSQDGRPPKMIRQPPWLVVCNAPESGGMAGRLRQSGIPAEGMMPRNAPGWEKETLGKALGDNYHVCVREAINTLLDVYRQQRIEFSESLQNRPGLERHIDELCNLQSRGDEIADAAIAAGGVTALALPVWFRETIKYSRPYRV